MNGWNWKKEDWGRGEILWTIWKDGHARKRKREERRLGDSPSAIAHSHWLGCCCQKWAKECAKLLSPSLLYARRTAAQLGVIGPFGGGLGETAIKLGLEEANMGRRQRRKYNRAMGIFAWRKIRKNGRKREDWRADLAI